MDTLFKLIFL